MQEEDEYELPFEDDNLEAEEDEVGDLPYVLDALVSPRKSKSCLLTTDIAYQRVSFNPHQFKVQDEAASIQSISLRNCLDRVFIS